MGMGMESVIVNVSKKNADENNKRLDQLIAEQKRTNELLDRLGALLASQFAPAS